MKIIRIEKMKIELYPDNIFLPKVNKPGRGQQMNVPAILIFRNFCLKSH